MRISGLLVFSAIRKYSCGHKQVVERSSAEQALFAVKRTLEWSKIPFSKRRGMWPTGPKTLKRRNKGVPLKKDFFNGIQALVEKSVDRFEETPERMELTRLEKLKTILFCSYLIRRQ